MSLHIFLLTSNKVELGILSLWLLTKNRPFFFLRSTRTNQTEGGSPNRQLPIGNSGQLYSLRTGLKKNIKTGARRGLAVVTG